MYRTCTGTTLLLVVIVLTCCAVQLKRFLLVLDLLVVPVAVLPYRCTGTTLLLVVVIVLTCCAVQLYRSILQTVKLQANGGARYPPFCQSVQHDDGQGREQEGREQEGGYSTMRAQRPRHGSPPL